MNSTQHSLTSIGLSVAAGAAFGLLSSTGDPLVQDFFPIAVFVGGVVGFVLSPAAGWARADAECRASFAWVVVPTAVLTWSASEMRGAGVGFLVSVATYLISCSIVGLVAMPRRRRLNWYAGGCCSSCGYDVRGLEGPKCPECGEIARVRPATRKTAAVLREEARQ
ncbi:MAG: hypothetical protein HND58_14630 [Planctomycetota bacterium]|nr:MAG: hypothetical protein HND58_14630 [Planctomycetota bacterium]